jgi:hypothetical protein
VIQSEVRAFALARVLKVFGSPSPSTTPFGKRKSCEGCLFHDTKNGCFVNPKNEIVKRIFFRGSTGRDRCWVELRKRLLICL